MDPKKRASVLVADAEPAARSGLIHLIDSHPRLRVCAETDSLAGARQLCVQHRPQVLLMDLALGDGFALIKDLTRQSRQTRVVIFAALVDAISVQRALQAGVRAFLSRRDPLLTVITAILDALEDKRHVGPHVEAVLLDRLASRAVEFRGDDIAALSSRELQILKLMGTGNGTRAVAASLGISMKTVATHQQRMKEKLGIRFASELQQRAFRFCLEARD